MPSRCICQNNTRLTKAVVPGDDDTEEEIGPATRNLSGSLLLPQRTEIVVCAADTVCTHL